MAFQLNPELIRETVSKATQELPPLPNVLVKILQLTESSDSGSVSEIEQLIRSDQAISSKLLRVVNSAYFGLSGQVASVSQAIVVLGYQQVRNLVLSVSMMSSFSAVNSKAKDAQQRLWESAFATASVAQLIARKKRFDARDQELVFVGGLLQNIGGLFMLSTLSRSYLSVLEEAFNTGSYLADVENIRLGLNHAEVGRDLFTRWKLPEPLVLLVARHEGPFAGEVIPALAAVHIAERMGDLVLSGKPITLAELKLDDEHAAWLNFSDEEFAWIEEEARIKIDAALDLIGALRG